MKTNRYVLHDSQGWWAVARRGYFQVGPYERRWVAWVQSKWLVP